MLKEELYTQSQVDTIEYLAKGFAKAEEQERIIKLLEDYAEKNYEFTLTAERDLIALIKGENK